MIPLKWQTHSEDDWYFEKQNDNLRWIEYAKGKFWANFTQTSLEYDAVGRLEVILVREKCVVKLTEGISYLGGNVTWIRKILSSGYWVRKDGRLLIFQKYLIFRFNFLKSRF